LRTSDPSIPLFLERAVDRALAKTPADRFQTANAFAEALTSEIVVAWVGRPRWPRRVVAAVALVVVLLAAWGLFTLGGGSAYERLAVLTPANLMNDPEQAYFVQGVHTALISELQRAGIAVIARTSVLQYENTQKPIREIASELGVDVLVEASVFRAADSLEIEVNVVDGTTQQYVADPIVRRSALRDVERLYRGLTAAIATEIQAVLTPQAEAHLASARPVNPQAYEAYLKGIFHTNRFTPADLDQAFEYFQQAQMLDSAYALAHQGIALVWITRGWMMLATPREAAARATVAVQQALALDSTLGTCTTCICTARNVYRASELTTKSEVTARWGSVALLAQSSARSYRSLRWLSLLCGTTPCRCSLPRTMPGWIPSSRAKEVIWRSSNTPARTNRSNTR
jgi:TolB-like protein